MDVSVRVQLEESSRNVGREMPQVWEEGVVVEAEGPEAGRGHGGRHRPRERPAPAPEPAEELPKVNCVWSAVDHRERSRCSIIHSVVSLSLKS